MRVEVLSVGDELLDGRVQASNSTWLARRLRPLGVRLARVTVLPDDGAAIEAALAAASARGVQLLVITGGLGVTDDDRTRQALARWLGVGLVEDADGLAALEAKLVARGRTTRPVLRGHARVPDGAAALANPVGLAVGVDCARDGMRVMALPGVPGECEAMIEAHVAPLIERLGGGAWRQAQALCCGLGESEVEARLDGLDLGALELGLTAGAGLVGVSLSARGRGADREATRAQGADREATRAQDADLEATMAQVVARLAPHVVTRDGASLARHLIARLTARRETLSVAESCTGGLLASTLTDVPGASAVVLDGVVAYANESKARRLGVAVATLERYGAVSRHAVREMAAGARAGLGADWSAATSGVAGPGGGSAARPVGLVHVAIEGPGVALHRVLFLPGRSRALIKEITVNTVLGLLACAVEGREPWPAPPLPPGLDLG